MKVLTEKKGSLRYHSVTAFFLEINYYFVEFRHMEVSADELAAKPLPKVTEAAWQVGLEGFYIFDLFLVQGEEQYDFGMVLHWFKKKDSGVAAASEPVIAEKAEKKKGLFGWKK